MGLCCSVVEQGTLGVVTRCGRFSHTLGPGLHPTCICVGDELAGTLNLRIRDSTFPGSFKTRDGVFVSVTLSVQYHVQTERAYHAFFRLASPEDLLHALIRDAMRPVVASMTLDELFSAKDVLARQVAAAVAAPLDVYGYTMDKLLILEIEPPPGVRNAMNEIQRCARLAGVAREQAEAERLTAVKAAEGRCDSAALAGVGAARRQMAVTQGLCLASRNMLEHVQGVTYNSVAAAIMLGYHCDVLASLAHKHPSPPSPHSPSLYEAGVAPGQSGGTSAAAGGRWHAGVAAVPTDGGWLGGGSRSPPHGEEAPQEWGFEGETEHEMGKGIKVTPGKWLEAHHIHHYGSRLAAVAVAGVGGSHHLGGHGGSAAVGGGAALVLPMGASVLPSMMEQYSRVAEEFRLTREASLRHATHCQLEALRVPSTRKKLQPQPSKPTSANHSFTSTNCPPAGANFSPTGANYPPGHPGYAPAAAGAIDLLAGTSYSPASVNYPHASTSDLPGRAGHSAAAAGVHLSVASASDSDPSAAALISGTLISSTATSPAASTSSTSTPGLGPAANSGLGPMSVPAPVAMTRPTPGVGGAAPGSQGSSRGSTRWAWARSSVARAGGHYVTIPRDDHDHDSSDGADVGAVV